MVSSKLPSGTDVSAVAAQKLCKCSSYPSPKRANDGHDALSRVQELASVLAHDVRETEKHIDKQISRKREHLQRRQEAVSTNHLLCRATMETLRHCDEVATEAAGCLSRLQHEHYSLGGALLLSERRLELREELPADEVHDALISEQGVLSTARRTILDIGAKLMVLIEDLGQLRSEIAREGAMFRQRARGERSAVPDGDDVSRAAAPLGVQRSKPADLERDDVLQQGLRKLRGEVDELAKRTEVAHEKNRQDCARANARVCRKLEQNISDLAASAKRLRGGMSEADASLSNAEWRLERSIRRLATKDSVTLSWLSNSKDRIVELRTTRGHLEGDLLNTLAALRVEEACKKLTTTGAVMKDTPLRCIQGRLRPKSGGSQ